LRNVMRRAGSARGGVALRMRTSVAGCRPLVSPV
jgi:hypothetical protein